MAIRTKQFSPNPFLKKRPDRKWITKTRLVKTDIVRQGITGWTKIIRARKSRHDPKTPAQMRIRGFMHAIKRVYDTLDLDEKKAWGIKTPLRFFRSNLARLIAGQEIIRTPAE